MAFVRERDVLTHLLGLDAARLVLEFHQPLTDNTQRRQHAITVTFTYPPLFRFHLYSLGQYYFGRLTDDGLRFHHWDDPLFYSGPSIDPGSWWLPIQCRVAPVGRYTTQFSRPLRPGQKSKRQAVRNTGVLDDFFDEC